MTGPRRQVCATGYEDGAAEGSRSHDTAGHWGRRLAATPGAAMTLEHRPAATCISDRLPGDACVLVQAARRHGAVAGAIASVPWTPSGRRASKVSASMSSRY